MLRFYFAITISLGLICYYIPRMSYMAKRPEKYNEERCYKTARKVVEMVRRRSRVVTHAYGLENLPKEGGYIMYPNHQGKYDALGLINSHPMPCTVVMELEKSKIPLMSQFLDMIHGKRLDRTDLRSQARVMAEIVDEVKQGRRYIIFPEGAWGNNGNTLQPFMDGCFKCALRAKVPIVPVVLVDSYKVYGFNSLKKVTTYVYFLPSIPYEVFAKMKTGEISLMVRKALQDKLDEVVPQLEKKSA